MVQRIVACLSLALFVALSGSALAQTAIPYQALEKEAVNLAAIFAADSSGATDLVLTSITTGQMNMIDGTSQLWQYQFYSASMNRVVAAGIVSIDGVFTRYFWYQFTPPDVNPAPTALDTTGAFVGSAALGAKLMGSTEYQRFRMDHPTEDAPAVALSNADPMYPTPPGFADGEAVWTVYSSRYGDSLFLCQYGTESDTLVCGWRFFMDAYTMYMANYAGDIEYTVTNIGPFGGDFANQAGGFTVPAGSGRDYIYGSGLWVGAVTDDGEEPVSTSVMGYNPNNGASDFRPGDGYLPRTSYSHPNLYLAGQYDATTGEPVEQSAEFRWPLWLRPGSAPPSFMEPGAFVLRTEDRVAGASYTGPAMVSDVSAQFVARYSDAYASMSSPQTVPIGLQVQENVFGNPAGFDFTVFVSYMVINQSGDTLDDVVLAPMVDFDIGTAGNDRSRFYVERPELRSAVAWTGTEGGQPFGTLAITLLEAPMLDDAGFVDNALRSLYRTQGRASAYRSWTIETDPDTPGERYDFMTSGVFDPDIAAGDRRGLLASRPFRMAPGDTAYLAVSYTVLPNVRSAQAANPSVEYRVENLINAYYGIEAAGVENETHGSSLDLTIAPNPARDRLAVTIASPRSGAATVELFTPAGEAALTPTVVLDGTATHSSLDVSTLPNGVYTLVVTSAGARSARSVVIVR